MVALSSMSANRIKKDVLLARYTTWGVGGVADYLYCPASIEELQSVLANWDSRQPVTWIGLGSNLLIRDGGIRGLVVLVRGGLEQLYMESSQKLFAQAGVTCAKVAKLATAHRLSGAEFFAGIPGTMGGALAMNAGAYGCSTWDLVDSAQVVHRDGGIEWLSKESFEIGYRYVNKPDDTWFTAVRLALAVDENGKSKDKVKKIMTARNETQPIGKRSCGSVFKNPSNQFAAQLIDQCGLKGFCIGGACVSDKHANFIINQGNATASDIEQLIRHIQQRVHNHSGVWLEPEVRVIGESVK